MCLLQPFLLMADVLHIVPETQSRPTRVLFGLINVKIEVVIEKNIKSCDSEQRYVNIVTCVPSVVCYNAA